MTNRTNPIARSSVTGSRNRNQSLVYDVLTAVSRAHAEGRARTVERFGFSAEQAEKIARLSAHQLHRIANTGINLFEVTVDGRRLDQQLKSMRREQTERVLQNRLLALGAPAELMNTLYGWSHQETAERRRQTGLAGADSGRPRRTSEEEELAIWKSWRGSSGMTDAERLETVASETGIKLNIVWSQIKRWRDSGRMPGLEPGNGSAGVTRVQPDSPGLRGLWRRLRHRPDTEHEQALIRTGVAILLFGYVLFSAPHDPYVALHTSFIHTAVMMTGIGSVLVSMLIVATILIWPGTVVTRRLVAMALDIAVPSVYFWYQGEFGALYYVVYLWIVIGHGFRFGYRYLIGATLLATSAYAAIVAHHPYWDALGALPYTLMVGLVVLPIWIAALMHSKTASQRRAQAARLHHLAGLEVREDRAGYSATRRRDAS